LHSGPGTTILSGSNSYSGGTTVSGGTLVLASSSALPTGNALTVGTAGTLQIARSTGNVSYLATAGSLNNTGVVDISNNAIDIQNASANIGTITAQIAAAYNGGAWNGNVAGGVITSSAAASDTTHLTAVGIATGFGSFNAQGTTVSVNPQDVLIKYTYYGDTNLDGRVDGSDYSRIDNGVLQGLTGWQNGDFNYDGVINGSDYTLIDNAFNTQGAQLSAEVASATSQIAGAGVTSAVPEPASLGLFALGAAGLLGRRGRRHR
jgi:autotransporter-associated beta strand protein